MTTLQVVDPKASKQLDTKTQAPSLDTASKVVDEAEGNKGILMHKLVEAAKAWAQAEDSLSKVLGAALVTAISHLIKLPSKIRPKYTEIAKTISVAMDRTIPLAAQFKLPDETLQVRFGKSEAYRQQATRWVDMARWEIGEYTKQEQKHQERTPGWKSEVTISGQVYTSPVSALSAGIAYSTVHTHFRNILRPTYVDLTQFSDKVQERLAADLVTKGAKGGLQVPMRGPGKDGQIVKTRTPILGNAALTHGAVKALLAGLSGPVTQRRYDELQAAMLLIKPEPKPEAK